MQFIHQPLTWAFFLVLVPLLIHLINMMRHRRVRWAAMDFLLKSYKKHKRWVWLKQLLLLLTRMAAVAAVVAMLAQLVTSQQWSRLFGGSTTHHLVLLDDSYSMADRRGNTTAFDLAGQALQQIVRQVSEQDTLQRITLIRFSQAARFSQLESEQAVTLVDLNAEPVSSILNERIEETRRRLQVTDLAVGPLEALRLAEALIKERPDDRTVLHLLSDFRQNDWQQPAELREQLDQLADQGVQLQLVRCANRHNQNLSLVDLEPAGGTLAAGVPLLVNVKVRNRGTQPAEQVLVKIHTTRHPRTADGSEGTSQTDDLPDVLIERIDPGETVTRQIQVFFPTAGQHVIEARLPHDAVENDNQRWSVVDLPEGVPVLVLDDRGETGSAYYLNAVFQPGARTNTGIRPITQPVSYVRDANLEELQRFAAIYLLDAPRLDGRAVENLENYVRNGGGLAITLGPESDLAFYDRWYADGQGLFPVPPQTIERLPIEVADDAPDLQLQDHPVFRALVGERNPFVRSIRIQQYVSTPAQWTPPDDSTIRVLAYLRNRQPLVVERRFGQGRVVASLTSFDPSWNNWSGEPSFIVFALQLHDYLASQQAASDRLVGTPVSLQLPASDYRPNVDFLIPGQEAGRRRVVRKSGEAVTRQESTLLTAVLGRGEDRGQRTGETDARGVYEAQFQTLAGVPQRRRYALNVAPAEGELALVEPPQLVEQLDPVRVEIQDADQLVHQADSTGGFSWSQTLLFALIGLLLVEQGLAYSASYHPRSLAPAGGAK